MKLRDAMLCISCEEIFNPMDSFRHFGITSRCLSCGSDSTMRISRWLKTMEEYERKKPACRQAGSPAWGSEGLYGAAER